MSDVVIPRYVVQYGDNVDGFRITDRRGDNRIATCYDRGNATLVCSALNINEHGVRVKPDDYARFELVL